MKGKISDGKSTPYAKYDGTSSEPTEPWPDPYMEAVLFARRIPPGTEEPRQHAASCELFKIGLDHVPKCTCGLEQPPK